MSKILLKEEIPNFVNNHLEEDNYFISNEKKESLEEKKEDEEISDKIENVADTKNNLYIELNNSNDIEAGDHILYEEFEVEMDDEEAID